jgi:hypothetical protein
VSDDRALVWPFGKHKGTRVEDVPTDYLEWALRETDIADRYPDVAEEADAQIRMRAGEGRAVKR